MIDRLTADRTLKSWSTIICDVISLYVKASLISIKWHLVQSLACLTVLGVSKYISNFSVCAYLSLYLLSFASLPYFALQQHGNVHMNKLIFTLQAQLRYKPNGPMRFIIAIVLGTLAFQGSSLQIPRSRDVRTRDLESTTSEHDMENTREKRFISSTSGGTERQTNVRIVRIFHKYKYFLRVSNDGKVEGTHDTVNGNGKSGNLNVFL